MMGAILLGVGFIGLWAPNASENAVDVASESDRQVRALRQAGELEPAIRNRALALVALLWAGAIGTVLTFMIMSMTYAPEDRPNPTEFTVNIGPWIIVATIILPALIAGWLASKKRRGEHLLAADEEPATGGNYVLDHLYRALVLPLVSQSGLEKITLRVWRSGRYVAEMRIETTDATLAGTLGQAGFVASGDAQLLKVEGTL